MVGLRMASSQTPVLCRKEAEGLLVQTRSGAAFKGQKAHKRFKHKLFAPHLKPPVLGLPRKKLMCLISWERARQRYLHELFRGDWGQKTGSQTKSLVYCFFLAPMLAGNLLGI